MPLSEFAELGLSATNVFGSSEFLLLNRNKADRVVCALSDDGNIGIALGLKDGTWHAPWSAPYLSLSTAGSIAPESVRAFGQDLRNMLQESGVRFVFPPDVHQGPEKDFFAGFHRPGDTIVTDTSFYIAFGPDVEERPWNKSARRNLKKAVAAGLTAKLTDDAAQCYNLIRNHHEALGYSMAMTLPQVMDTAAILPVDFWVAFQDDSPVAAMYCYRVRPDMVQVISSGDTPKGRRVGAAVFMERVIIDYYRQMLVETEGLQQALLDHGPTSVGGVQNHGLAEFKTSFGCLLTPKVTLLG